MGNDLLKAFTSWLGGGQAVAQPSLSQDAYRSVMDVTGNAVDPNAVNLFSSAPGTQAAVNPSFMDSLTGWTGQDGIKHAGWGNLALGAGQGILSGWLGMQQLDQAKAGLEESKRQFDKNFETQQKLTNTRLEDRQRARVASNPNAYQSVGDYMKKNGV